jgi:CheY-like chemotaxis protein
MKSNLAKLLVREALVNIDQIRNAMEFQRDSGYELGESLVHLGYVSESQLVELLGREYGVPVMNIDDCDIEENVLSLVPRDTALEKFLVPIRAEGPDLTVAMSDPSNILLLDDLGFITGKNIKPVISSDRAIKAKLSKYYGRREEVGKPSDDEAAGESGSSDRLNTASLFTDRNSGRIDEIINELEQYEKDNSSENSFTEPRDKHPGAQVDYGIHEINVEHQKEKDVKDSEEAVNNRADEFVSDFTVSSTGDSVSSVTDSDAEFSKSGTSFEANPPHSESAFSHMTNEFGSESPELSADADSNEDSGKAIGFTSPFDNGAVSPGEFSRKIDNPQENFNVRSGEAIKGSDDGGVEEIFGGSREFESGPGGRKSEEELQNDTEADTDIENHIINNSSAQEFNADNLMHGSGADNGGGDADSVEESAEIAQVVNSSQPINTEKKRDDGRGSILIVDVSPTVQKIMRITLERAGFRVYAAGDGMQALARINEVIPNMIFMDIKLPHMDGYQLCKVIKSHGLTKDVPVVMLSGKAGVLDKMKVKMAGASDFLAKPFGSNTLVEAAEKYTR